MMIPGEAAGWLRTLVGLEDWDAVPSTQNPNSRTTPFWSLWELHTLLLKKLTGEDETWIDAPSLIYGNIGI